MNSIHEWLLSRGEKRKKNIRHFTIVVNFFNENKAKRQRKITMRLNYAGHIADCGRDPCCGFIVYLFHAKFVWRIDIKLCIRYAVKQQNSPKNYTFFHHQPFQNLRDHNFNEKNRTFFSFAVVKRISLHMFDIGLR